MSESPDEPGVFARRPDGRVAQVHAYQDGDYVLTDIVELFALGRVDRADDGRPALILTLKELRQLKATADAHSFDYEDGLIELCVDLHRFAAHGAGEQILFWSDL